MVKKEKPKISKSKSRGGKNKKVHRKNNRFAIPYLQRKYDDKSDDVLIELKPFKWTEKSYAVLEMCYKGETIKEICKKLRIKNNTYYTMISHPEFKRTLRKMQISRIEEIKSRRISSVTKMLNQIERRVEELITRKSLGSEELLELLKQYERLRKLERLEYGEGMVADINLHSNANIDIDGRRTDKQLERVDVQLLLVNIIREVGSEEVSTKDLLSRLDDKIIELVKDKDNNYIPEMDNKEKQIGQGKTNE